MLHPLKRLITEDDGMQLLEISVVGAVVAIAAIQISGRSAVFNNALAHLTNALTQRWFLFQ
jgi:hypothetical protein